MSYFIALYFFITIALSSFAAWDFSKNLDDDITAKMFLLTASIASFGVIAMLMFFTGVSWSH